MQPITKRIYFIDAIRAFAIIMMLQGHFVSSLLGLEFRDRGNWVYWTWEYFRGITAPIFFTITGFVFVFLLLNKTAVGLENPRVKKGVKRAIKLILWGYALHLSFTTIFNGGINSNFFLINVLHIIGLSVLLVIGLYVLLYKRSEKLFQYSLLIIGIAAFLWERAYVDFSFSFLPDFLANWFTKANGSVFVLFPWFGYVAAGGFMSIVFKRMHHNQNFYKWFIYSLLCLGAVLVYFSSFGLLLLHDLTGIEIFKASANYNYLFTRMGDVLLIFAVFAMLRKLFEHRIVVSIGSKTLSIYIIHFIVLYGSFTGIGLTRYLYAALSPAEAIIGALTFIVVICLVVVQYFKYEPMLKSGIVGLATWIQQQFANIRTRLIAMYRLSKQRNR